MSTTYTYTRNPYTQIASWPGYVVLPVDGDPFTAQSVNIYEKTIQDRNMYIFEGTVKNINMSSSIRMESTDSVSIQIYPFILQVQDSVTSEYKLVVSKTILTATSANLITPGSFTANTWYYVYLHLKMDGTTEISIDDSGPDIYLIYKDSMGMSDKSYKFLGTFRTGSGGFIKKFYKNGQRVSYLNSQIVTIGTATTPTVQSLQNFIPPISRMVTIGIDCFNGNNATSNFFTVISNFSPGVIINLQRDTTLKRFIHSVSFEYNVDNTQSITYNWNTSGVNVSTALITVLGYRE